MMLEAMGDKKLGDDPRFTTNALRVENMDTLIPLLEVQYPFLLNVTQGLWAGMVALSMTTLIRDHGFGMKNVLFTGVLFCFIIHGLKISIRYVFYGKTVGYLIDRFLYGSLLVMCIPVIIGPVLIYFRDKGVRI